MDAEPPYYAVIFTSRRTGEDEEGYAAMDDRLMELAVHQPGFLGIESANSDIGITVSYWRDEASIAAWRRDAEHRMGQQAGRDRWYAHYSVRIARVERAYDFHCD